MHDPVELEIVSIGGLFADYSWRSADIGSVRDARKAGITAATIDTTASTNGAAANVSGSLGLT